VELPDPCPIGARESGAGYLEQGRATQSSKGAGVALSSLCFEVLRESNVSARGILDCT
jgi:hypothetical protein